MTDGPVISGPHPEPPSPELVTALGTLWTAVSRAGGATGFVPDSSEADIRVAAAAAVDEVAAGHEDLLVLRAGPDLVGVVFLRPGQGPRVGHRAHLLRLMIDPSVQGRGLGTRLLDGAVAHAVGLGLEQLLLSARGGTDLPAFYTARGWTEVGVFPGAVRLSPDDARDEHWFQLRL